MISFRHAAFRALRLPPPTATGSSIATQSRSYVQLSPSLFRFSRSSSSVKAGTTRAGWRASNHTPAISLQRRWNSQEVPPASQAKETTETTVKETETQTADEVPEAAAPELVKETVTKTKTETPAQSTAQASTESQPTQPRAEAGADQDSSFKPSSTGRPAPQPCETVYVGNLFFDVSAEQLGQHMAQFGPVEAVRIIHDARGLSRGFGYVRFDSIESARRAIESMHMEIYEGRRTSVNFAHYSNAVKTPNTSVGSKTPTKTLFVGNMSFDMTDRDLNNLFWEINNVTDVRVSIDRRTGRPRGFVHVDFLDVESAIAAKEVLSSKPFFGRPLRVDYTYGNRATNAQRPPENSE